MIQRGSGIAVWWQIVQTLEKDIADEVFKPGGRLPSEAELAERFAVNRHTIRRAVAETASITAALRGYGVDDYERTESRITARLPDEATAQLLQQPRGQPILQVEGVNVDQDGKPVEYCISRFAGDAVQLVVND